MLDSITQFIINSITFFQFFTVIDIYERGIVLRFGEFNRRLSSGFHFIAPFYIDQVMTHETVLTTRSMGTQTLTTSDDIQIVLTSTVTYKISDVKKLLLEVEQAETVLEDTIYGIITNKVLTNKLSNILKPKFSKAILKAIRKDADNYGIEVINFFFTDLAKIKTIRIITDSDSTIALEE